MDSYPFPKFVIGLIPFFFKMGGEMVDEGNTNK